MLMLIILWNFFQNSPLITITKSFLNVYLLFVAVVVYIQLQKKLFRNL